MKTVTTVQMKVIDTRAITEMGIPSLFLMENAASRVTEAVLDQLAGECSPRVLVVCGTGNNGGDGLACARQLIRAGIPVETILVGDPGKLTPDASANVQALRSCGGSIRPYSGEVLPETSLIVDALFGFGLNREVRGQYREVIEKMNGAGKPIVSCDIPSGLNGDTGEVLGAAVRAEQTVCFTCAKPGLLLPCAAEYVGKLTVAEIGIPAKLLEEASM